MNINETWINIDSTDELERFLGLVKSMHDAITIRADWTSAARILENRSLTQNGLGTLHIVINSQLSTVKSFEMKFQGVSKYIMDDDYDATPCFEFESNSVSGRFLTWNILADSMFWRLIDADS